MFLFILHRRDDGKWFAGSNKWTSDQQEAKLYKKESTARGVRTRKENKKEGPIFVVKLETREVETL